MGRFYFGSTIATEVAIAKVVGINKNYIGLLLGCRQQHVQ